ncbi:CPBP family intramembrane metalloprotease [Paenibacillus sp. HN-1]|uniref:CPBP family intramembrane glutamic endopeptidase n=1 Tax=Paenibacillus TaxID=44249 RepID=UPI001CA9C89F|nr:MULTISPECIES: CPBP family intramembrane glutamic endopeptidase [Paenibacillus]MBY9080039.1 CPBP family intramembrane metalloprotease [Paenibacillus sp. CGMCC 1.18879]MBY9086737.1 CPBP family intramembrane metalloprotease [Paenibacillus sinensis]
MSIPANKKSFTKSFTERRPVLAVVLIEVLLFIAVFMAGAYATIKELSFSAPILISYIPITAVLVLYFTLKRKWGFYGFRSLSSIPKGDWRYYLPLLVLLAIIALKGFRQIEASEVLFYLGFTLLVGFVEESIYRGLIVNILRPKSVRTAVITSSVLFGVTHVLSVLSGQDAFQTVLQIVYALLLGGALALLMIRNRNILPLILFHFLHNFIQFVGNDNSDAYLGIDLAILVLLAAYCFWLALSLRKSPLPRAAGQGINSAQ